MRSRWQTAAAMRNALRYAAGRQSVPPADAAKDPSSITRLAAAVAAAPPMPASTATLIHGSGDPSAHTRVPTITNDPSKPKR